LFLARDTILRRKTQYDKENLESKMILIFGTIKAQHFEAWEDTRKQWNALTNL